MISRTGVLLVGFLFAAAGFFWLLIMIVLTGADYWHRTDALAPIDRSSF